MLDIVETNSGYEVRFPYKPWMVAAIKQIPGASFRGAGKFWHVPAHSSTALLNWAKTFGAAPKQQTTVQIGEIDPLPELLIEIQLRMEMFPYQRNGVAYAIDKKRLIIGDQPGLGKAQPLTSKIATPNGWALMADIKEGNDILGADGKTYKVTGVFPQGKRPVYKISFNDGSTADCDINHLWKVREVNRRRRQTGWVTRTTEELITAGVKYRINEARAATGRKQILKFEIPITKAFDYTAKKYIIHPYILGALLGDGSMCNGSVCISIPDSEIETKNRIETLLPAGLKFWLNRYTGCPQYYITQTGTTNKNPFMKELENLNLNVKGKLKFIPEKYLFGSKNQRIQLLRGLMDTDGSAKGGRITYHTCSELLANSIADLVFSLGGQAILRPYNRINEGKGMEWQVNIRLNICPFFMKRKAEQWNISLKNNFCSKYIENIEFIEETATQCISVSAPDHLYLTDHFIVTHNTAQAIATVEAANCKCILIICPATLRENWKREIEDKWTWKKALILSDRVRATWPQYYKVGMIKYFICNYESLKKYFVESINRPLGKDGQPVPLRLNHIKFKDTIDLFDAVIIDEVHRCKDGKTQQSKFVMGIAKGKEFVLALTGTPVVNKPIDLIPQLHIINRLENFGGYTGFVDRYCQGFNQASNLKELNYLLHKHCFYRREKSEVLKDLPDKMRSIIKCDIENRAEYTKAENNLKAYLKENMGKSDAEITKSLRGEVMVMIQILKKIAARGKIDSVVEHINEVVDAGEKIVVFAWHKEIVHELKKAIPESVTIVGDDSMDQRQRAVDGFQNDPKVQVIICNIKSGGVGITLTASSRVSFIELPWHPADCEQGEDRCIAKGQLIMTKEGFKKVEEVIIGDLVYSASGFWRKVTDTWNKLERTKAFVEIKYKGFSEPLKVTDDHRVYVYDKIEGEYKYIESKSIDIIRHMLVFANPYPDVKKPIVSEIFIDMVYGKDYKHASGSMMSNTRVLNPLETVKLTDELMFAFGWYLAEGWTAIAKTREKGSLVAICGNATTEGDKIKSVAETFIKEFGLLKSKVSVATNKANCTSAYIYSKNLAHFFNETFGSTSATKSIPDFVFNTSKDHIKSFLKGYYEGDGYTRKNTQQASTKSDKIAIGLCHLEALMGKPITLRKTAWDGWSFEYALKDKVTRDSLILNINNTVLFPIQQITIARPSRGNERVYDLTIEHDESFTVGLAAVHNCHRIGQKGSVQCSYFLGANTIDEYIYDIIEKKRSIVNQVTGSEEDIETVEKNMVDQLIGIFKSQEN